MEATEGCELDMREGIAFAGSMVVDIIKFISAYPKPQSLCSIINIQRAPGGLACNCAIDMAKLDSSIPVEIIGAIGNDEQGEFLLSEFSKFPSINTKGISKKGVTAYTDVMTEPDGGRTFFAYSGANMLLGPEDFHFTDIRARILHIGYLLILDRLDEKDDEYGTAMARVLAQAKANGMITSIDVVSEESERFTYIVPPALKYADYCIINETEAGQIARIPLRDGSGILEEHMPSCLMRLAEMGVSRWVVIHAPELSYGLDVQNGLIVRQESWKIPPDFKKSSVGAGDAFACGILHCAYHNEDLKTAINVAGAIAAYSLSGNGASDAIERLPVVMDRMRAMQ